MILFELFSSEDHPIYQELHVSNGDRHYDFLRSVVDIAIKSNKICLSQTIIKAINYHAICCLHSHAGEYRPCPVKVGEHNPPDHYRVQALMDDFVNEVNVNWNYKDPVYLATYVLWRLNNIHPFINGNGRTARAACYFVLCLKAGAWLVGQPILPELLRRDRDQYCIALQHAHESAVRGPVDLAPLFDIVQRLISEQLSSIPMEGDDMPSPLS